MVSRTTCSQKWRQRRPASRLSTSRCTGGRLGRVARVTSRAPVLLAHGGPESARGNGPGLGIKGSEAHPLELSASIYSSLLRRTIATVGMQYFGSSRADAISKLIHKLVTVIPGAVCAGWRWPASAP